MKYLSLTAFFFFAISTLFAQNNKLQVSLCGSTADDAMQHYTSACIVEVTGVPQDMRPVVISFTVVIAPKHGSAMLFPMVGNKMSEVIQPYISKLKTGDLVVITDVKYKYFSNGKEGVLNGPNYIIK